MGVLSFTTNGRANASSVSATLADVPGAARTMAILFRRSSDNGAFNGLAYLKNVGTVVFGMSINASDDAVVDIGAAAAATNSNLTSTTDTYLLVTTSGAGGHIYYWKQEPGGAWTSQNVGGALANLSDATNVELGAWEGGDFAEMKLGLVGIWNRELSQAQVESLDDNWATTDWLNVAGGGPVMLVPCNSLTLEDVTGNATGWSLTGGVTLDAAETLDNWNFGAAPTYPKAKVDWRRNSFPFILGDSLVQGRGRPSGPRESGGPNPGGGFERYLFPRLHPVYATQILIDFVPATETNTAVALTAQKLKTLVNATEADAAQAMTVRKLKTWTNASETDVAQAITSRTLVALTNATESDAAQALIKRKLVTLGLATETDVAVGITYGATQFITLIPAAESNVAQALTAQKRATLGISTEADTAQTLAHLKRVTFVAAAEADIAQALTTLTRVNLGVTTETDSAVAITQRKLKTLGVATTAETAQALSAKKFVSFSPSLEFDVAVPITIQGQEVTIVYKYRGPVTIGRF